MYAALQDRVCVCVHVHVHVHVQGVGGLLLLAFALCGTSPARA